MLALVTVVAPNCAAAQEESSSTQREHEVDELCLTLIYEGEMEPKQFLKTTACVRRNELAVYSRNGNALHRNAQLSYGEHRRLRRSKC